MAAGSTVTGRLDLFAPHGNGAVIALGIVFPGIGLLAMETVYTRQGKVQKIFFFLRLEQEEGFFASFF